MPEGDTVHKVAAVMRPELVGRELIGARARRLDVARLRHKCVDDLTVKGKHFFIGIEDDTVIRVHLGIDGTWHRYAPSERWHRPAGQAGLVLETAADVFVCFNPMRVDLMRRGSYAHRDTHRRLGPDLALAEVDLSDVPARARAFLDPETPLVDVLLDQRPASGLGNVYKSEIAFILRLDPLAPLAATTDATLARAYRLGHELLRANLGPKRRATRFEADDGGPLWVYDREDEPCLVCGAPVRAARLGRDARPTFWCDGCQPAGRSG